MLRTVRTFIAVDISSEVRIRAGRLIAQLQATGANVRWVNPEQLHLTLKFLGEIDLRDVHDLSTVVTRTVSTIPPFSLRVAGAGAFPDLAHPRTIWLGADEGTDEIAQLHEQLDIALAAIGYRREARRFRPHLTIGRVRGADSNLPELQRLLDEQRDYVGGVVDIDEVVVYSSELERSGPIHEPLASASLGGR